MSKGAKAKTTIELNGKLYDARTGRIITTTKSVESVASIKPSSPAVKQVVKATPPKPVTPAVKPSQGTVVDGFVKKPSRPITVNSKPKSGRMGPSHAVTTLEKSKTLMRPAVKKPKPILNNDQVSHKNSSFKKENPHRVQKAKSTQKSHLIQRFNHHASPHQVIKKAAVLPVVTQKAASAQNLSQRAAELATSTEARLHESVDVIEQSLRNASAHLEKFEGKVAKSGFWSRVGFKNKAANIVCASFAGLLLLGFFAYQNTPSIEMRLAATRSDVSAQLPKYRPAGFSNGQNIQSAPGKVSVSFYSNSDDRNFTLTQQASNWSSDSLLSNHVLATKQSYQTYQQAGKTVYIYDNSNATWVNKGVWYKLEGNASLTSDQLLRIANSL